jgi:hypothetical protein
VLPTGDREGPGGPEGKDNHPQDGSRGRSQLDKVSQKTRVALKILQQGTRFFTDSSAVLGMLRTESRKFNDFVGARVSEVKVNSDAEEEWRWLEGNCNPADLGTRANATPQDLTPESQYQIGKSWMVDPESTWPWKKSFSPALEEEFRKDMLEGACNVVKGLQPPGGEEDDDFPTQVKEGLERLVRIYGYVIVAVYKWRKKKEAAGPIIINSTKKSAHVIGYPSLECLRSAELYLLEQAQRGMKISEAKMLAMDVVTEEDINGVKRKLIVIGSREKNQIEDIYGQTELPVLAREHPT